MKKKMDSLLIMAFFPMIMLAQSKVTDCSKIRNGAFYFYPPNSKDEYRIYRKGSVQMEVNVTTKDTSFWKVSWKNGCLFNMNFIRMNKKVSNEEYKFYKEHAVVYHVLDIRSNYYIFSMGLDSINTSKPFVDTCWFHRSRK